MSRSTPKPKGHEAVLKAYGKGETRHLVTAETPRERMDRVVQDVQKKQKKKR